MVPSTGTVRLRCLIGVGMDQDRALELLQLAERAEPHVYGPDQRAWRARLNEAADEISQALGFFLDQGNGDAALRLAGRGPPSRWSTLSSSGTLRRWRWPTPTWPGLRCGMATRALSSATPKLGSRRRGRICTRAAGRCTCSPGPLTPLATWRGPGRCSWTAWSFVGGWATGWGRRSS